MKTSVVNHIAENAFEEVRDAIREVDRIKSSGVTDSVRLDCAVAKEKLVAANELLFMLTSYPKRKKKDYIRT